MKPSFSAIVKSYVNHRSFALDNKIAMADMKKLKAITTIKNHMAYAKNCTDDQLKNIVRHLLPEMEAILPGKCSEYYQSMSDKLNEIKSIVNGRG